MAQTIHERKKSPASSIKRKMGLEQYHKPKKSQIVDGKKNVASTWESIELNSKVNILLVY